MKVDKLVKNVYETIMASGMICQGDSVVVGVSGGADSVCLLSVLKNLQMSMALQLTAVHIHHGLRGEAADRDRNFVTALCEDMQIPCVCFQADIRAMAREQHLSIRHTAAASLHRGRRRSVRGHIWLAMTFSALWDRRKRCRAFFRAVAGWVKPCRPYCRPTVCQS